MIARGRPRDVHYCHCSMCRRAAGSAFAVLVWFEASEIEWTASEPTQYRSSRIARRGFCPDCGTPLYLLYDGSKQIAIMLGVFDRADDLIPTHHYGVEGRLLWVDIARELEERQTAADPRPE